jgi:excisionase family DNA binding protein
MRVDPLLALPHLLEVAQVAHRLSASEEYVRRLIRTKKLPAIRLGVRWRVDLADLRAFIDAHRVKDLEARIARAEGALDGELGITPRGRDGPREVGRAS